ncbi:hypothetical protein SELMODRAFT_405623 [Selaginella moellendorffii]|uniref:Protein dpy-30 homolog n=1 Tax=Selaginella moellendorffii TaxID=88036 RepID=D8QZ64_SELML|nr:hypothetical protein SELMODRAFT_405623 [Selaginella moellendorffii]
MAPKAAPTPPPPPASEPAAVEAAEAPPPEPTFTGTWFDDPVEGEAAQQAALELKNRIEIRALSVRQFLEKTVVPLLLQGMHHLVLERPSNPVEYLAAFLLKNNPQGPEPPLPEELPKESAAGATPTEAPPEAPAAPS